VFSRSASVLVKVGPRALIDSGAEDQFHPAVTRSPLGGVVGYNRLLRFFSRSLLTYLYGVCGKKRRYISPT
jgi:hypothetical protein